MPSPKPANRPLTLQQSFAYLLKREIDAKAVVTFPTDRWKDDPVLFAKEVLGINLWEGQRRLVESIRVNRNTTCRSGHKVGKSSSVAVAALWFYATFPGARVLITAVKQSQVENVLWREIRLLAMKSRSGPYPIDGELNDTSRTGLRAPDGRQIFGLTARDGEGLAGISGANILLLADEASGINDRFFEVLDSSLGGSGGTTRKCYISNPTRTVGEFYRSHTDPKYAAFHRIHISSEDTPNARGLTPVPGLAGRDWINEKRIEWGEDSAQYKIRIRGEFVHGAEGKAITLDLIAAAQTRYDEVPDEGPVQIGVDPAGDGVVGDETAIAFRRGDCIRAVYTWRGLSEVDIVAEIVGLVRESRRPGGVLPRVTIDSEGSIGAAVTGLLREHLLRYPGEYDLVTVRAGKRAFGSHEYVYIRDALWGNLAKWLKAGGALPEDVRLEQDLNAPAFTADSESRYRVTDKKELRKLLGRSTDRGDAACLAVWQFDATYYADVEDSPAPRAVSRYDGPSPVEEIQRVEMDPWEAMRAFRSRR